MNFTQSVQSVFANYANFSGRASRAEYWHFVLFNILVSVIASILDGVIFAPMLGFMPLTLVCLLAMIVPSLGVLVRRLHDIGKSGWSWFICLIPIVGAVLLLIWLCRPGEEGPNAYGPNPLSNFGLGRQPVAA
ncbi:MAG TPA: DUF805 domain-containing protein [Roseomonas sp.]